MRKLVVMSFPDALKAFQGFYAIQALHRDRDVFVFGAAVIERNVTGTLSVKHRSEAPGLLLGSLVEGHRPELRQEVEQKLAPGNVAVIADVLELVTPIDARMEALGGRLVCNWWWNEYSDDLVEEIAERYAAIDAHSPAPHRSGWPRS